jgi:hypothetical protein
MGASWLLIYCSFPCFVKQFLLKFRTSFAIFSSLSHRGVAATGSPYSPMLQGEVGLPLAPIPLRQQAMSGRMIRPGRQGAAQPAETLHVLPVPQINLPRLHPRLRIVRTEGNLTGELSQPIQVGLTLLQTFLTGLDFLRRSYLL